MIPVTFPGIIDYSDRFTSIFYRVCSAQFTMTAGTPSVTFPGYTDFGGRPKRNTPIPRRPYLLF